MNKQIEFTNWLQKEIQKMGLSQNKFAKRAGISSGSISHILTGNRGAGPEVCLALAEALNLPPEEVFQRAGIFPESSVPDDPFIRRIIIILEQLNNEHREELYKYGKFRLQLQREG